MSDRIFPVMTTNGLEFLFDSAKRNSYPATGSLLIDLISKKTGAFTDIVIDNGAITFNGATSKIVFASPRLENVFDNGGTMSVWLKVVSDGQASFARILGTTQPGNIGYEFYTHGESGSTVDFCMIYNFDDTDGAWRLDNAVVLNEWTNVVTTYNSDSDANDALFYKNGVLLPTIVALRAVGTRQSNVGLNQNVGNRNDGGRTFDGDIAIMSVYNRELTASEILQNFEAHRRRFGI